MNNKSAFWLSLAACLALTAALAQDAATSDMDVIMEKIRVDKKLVVAANMDLTEAEQAAFWPVYQSYQQELENLNARMVAVVADYADGYNSGGLDDAMAAGLVDEILAIEAAELAAKEAVAGKLRDVIPGMQLARYLQIESKVRAAIRYEIAAGVPLIP